MKRDKKQSLREKSSEEKLVDEIRGLGRTYGLNEVFTTFLELFATGLAMEMDPIHAEERKKRYEELEASLDEEALASYGRMSLLLILVAAENMADPKDILGAVYSELRLNNEWSGQFFTPDPVCRAMAMMTGIGEKSSIEENELTTVCEPTCGSGALLIASIWAMRQKGKLPENMVFMAQDIDIRCVWMAYIQCCLYRIPAVIKHGNSLTMEVWSEWHTADYLRLVMESFREKSTERKDAEKEENSKKEEIAV
ncbi:MAG: N-6 DNA methylase [Lachnospiraceae bacterium]|nr:N-6 DNA methylase [Lachnospiraceae bacterium]